MPLPFVPDEFLNDNEPKKTMTIQKHLKLLGLKVKDSVTGFSGVVTSVSFDLFGCIQAVVSPGVDKDGKKKDCQWFDVNRLIVVSSKPVMNQPNFESGRQADGLQGSAEKPHSARF